MWSKKKCYFSLGKIVKKNIQKLKLCGRRLCKIAYQNDLGVSKIVSKRVSISKVNPTMIWLFTKQMIIGQRP